MMNRLRVLGGGETIAVPVQSNDYETAVTRAMARISEFVEGARVMREFEEAATGDWYLSGSECEVSAGGQSIAGKFYFTRHIETEEV